MPSASSLRTAPVEQLTEPLATAALSRSRMLPVVDPLVSLLPDGGLARGKAVACGGVAAMSLAVSLAVTATASGSWLAIVGVPTFGLEAAEEFGIPLERVVSVDLGPGRIAESDTGARPRRSGVNSRFGTAAAPAASPAALSKVSVGGARRRHVRRVRGRHHQGAATSQRCPCPARPGPHASSRGGVDHARLAWSVLRRRRAACQ